MPQVAPLFRINPRIAFWASNLVVKLKTIGVLDDSFDVLQLTVQELYLVISKLIETGFDVNSHRVDIEELDAPDLEALLQNLVEQVELTPLPQTELSAALRVLPAQQLSTLIGTQEWSLENFKRTNFTEFPEETAKRLHFVVMIISDLSGTYRTKGISLWFNRKRQALDGASPADILNGDWLVTDPKALAVKRLASSLVFLGAT